jgi:hypothetical protein
MNQLSLEQVNSMLGNLTAQKKRLESDRRNQLVSKRDALLLKVAAINAQLTPLLDRRVYAVRNVGDAILAVLPEYDNDNGMTTDEIITRVNEQFGTTYTPGTIRQGLRHYLCGSTYLTYSNRKFHSNPQGDGVFECARGKYFKSNLKEFVANSM